MTKDTAKTALRCIAPDGEYQTESHNFQTIDEAWEYGSNMGSRWYFYPIYVVTGPSNSNRARILDIPHGMPDYWKGKALKTLCAAIADNAEEICLWLNGDAPCPV